MTNKTTCLDCGVSNPQNSQFCVGCGRPLVSHNASTLQTSSKQRHPTKSYSGSSVWFLRTPLRIFVSALLVALVVFGVVITALVSFKGIRTTPSGINVSSSVTSMPAQGISTPVEGTNVPVVTPTSIPTAEPTATQIPSFFPANSKCKAGQEAGWKGWNPNPFSSWGVSEDGSAVSAKIYDFTNAPSFMGSPCNSLKIGSKVTVVFNPIDFGNDDGVLLLKVQGTDGNWYSIAFLQHTVRIQKNAEEYRTDYSLVLGTTYTFSMEITSTGINLLLDDSIINSQVLIFTPNGLWGLRAFDMEAQVLAVYVQ